MFYLALHWLFIMLNLLKSKPFPHFSLLNLFQKEDRNIFLLQLCRIDAGCGSQRNEAPIFGHCNGIKHTCLGPFLLLVCPSPSPVHRFSNAAMMVQSILENKCVGLSPVAVHAITKNWEGGGGQTFYSKITNSNDSPWM